MEIDLEQLREQYAMLTDEALREMDPNELVDAARECYDAELVQRGMRPAKRQSVDQDDTGEPYEMDGEEPEWIGEAMAAMSLTQTPGSNSAPDIDHARSILSNVRIPCYVATREPQQAGEFTVYELLVPPAHHLMALSVLDLELFNPQVEEEWKAHFETMTDQDLLDLDADSLVAGMRDRVDRLMRTYEDELLKRGLAELETDSAG